MDVVAERTCERSSTRPCHSAPPEDQASLSCATPTPANPADAIATAGPTGVDVSSGVCGPDGLKKDLSKVQAYCSRAAAAFAAAGAGAVAQ